MYVVIIQCLRLRQEYGIYIESDVYGVNSMYIS